MQLVEKKLTYPFLLAILLTFMLGNKGCDGPEPPKTFTLTVAHGVVGNGTVTSSPAGITCGTDCSEPYNSGTVVTLTATPAAGSTFAGWSGACTGTGSCTVNMDADKSATATFNLQTFVLTVSKAGAGNGTVTSSPAGISCGSTCSAAFAQGTSITLTATPDAGSTLAGWSGDPDCSDGQVTMSASKTCTATFVPGFSFFHTEGRDIIADSTGQKVAFRGVTLNGLEFGTFFANPYPGVEGTNYFKPRPEDFDELKALGFNVIRVPFEWARLVPGWRPTDPLPTALDKTYLGILDEVVQMAASRGLQVILDMHDFLKYWSSLSAQVCVDTSPEHQRLLAHTWKLLATHFATNPTVLGYDIMNEPVRLEEGELCGSCHWHAIARR